MSRGDIVVAEQREIECYVSEAGYICLRQVDIEFGKPVKVAILPMHAEAIAKAIMSNVAFAQQMRQQWVKEDEDEDE